MSSKTTIALEVNPILTVDDETAQLMLRLIEMYCDSKGLDIKAHKENGKRKYMFGERHE
jgi:hypothetical protein